MLLSLCCFCCCCCMLLLLLLLLFCCMLLLLISTVTGLYNVLKEALIISFPHRLLICRPWILSRSLCCLFSWVLLLFLSFQLFFMRFFKCGSSYSYSCHFCSCCSTSDFFSFLVLLSVHLKRYSQIQVFSTVLSFGLSVSVFFFRQGPI